MALLAFVVVAGLAAFFLIRGSTPGMDTRRHPNSLAVLEQVPVNGTQQWILIRSESTTNPVVLFVHDECRFRVSFHRGQEQGLSVRIVATRRSSLILTLKSNQTSQSLIPFRFAIDMTVAVKSAISLCCPARSANTSD